MTITTLEAGWLTYTSADAVIRAFEAAHKLHRIAKCDADPRHWQVDAGLVRAIMHGHPIDRALWHDMQRREAKAAQRWTP